jgi:hypothetical protein
MDSPQKSVIHLGTAPAALPQVHGPESPSLLLIAAHRLHSHGLVWIGCQ